MIDDDLDHNKAMEFLLTRNGWQVKTYSRATEFLTEDINSHPGCIVLDVNMPELSGIHLQLVMKEREIALPIIFLTGNGDIDMAVNTILEGAVDFLQKPVKVPRLLASVEKACMRSVKVSDPLLFLTKENARNKLKLLTSREMEIMKFVQQGLTSKVIALRLGISERTVEAHRTSACKKLNIHNTQGILELFILSGLND